MPRRTRWERLPTEAPNRLSANLDRLSPPGMIDLMMRDSRTVFDAVQREKARIARGAALIASAFLSGGRMIFVGAGTSGRLGVLEAAELPPTFGIEPGRSPAVMAGGRGAVYRAKEGVEDDENAGSRAISALKPGSTDVVIAISASGVTPFVRGAVERARASRARVVAITCNRRSKLKALADVAVTLDVGPELIAGSTRMKAGTATKIALNVLTTAAMVRSGKTYGNLMIDVKPGSAKLRDRAKRILQTVTGIDETSAATLLDRARWNVKAAVLMHERGLSRRSAALRLRAEPRLRQHLRRR